MFTAEAGPCELQVCPADTWGTPPTCTPCPANSRSVEGTELITACICDAGAEGEIISPEVGECNLCELGFYKGEIGAPPRTSELAPDEGIISSRETPKEKERHEF